MQDLSSGLMAFANDEPWTQVHGQRASTTSFFFLCLFTIAIYARPEDLVHSVSQLHLTFILGLCAGLAYLAAVLSGGVRLLWSRELLFVLLLTGWYIAGLPFAMWKSGSLHVLTGVWLKTLFAFFLLTQTLVTVARIRKLLWIIIISELITTSVPIVLPSRAIWMGERLLGISQGIFGWNFVGIAAALTIPYLATMFLVQRSILARALLIATFVSMSWMLVLTASRSGLFNVVFSVGATFLFVLRDSSRGRLVGIAIALVLLIAISFAPQVLWQRLDTVWDASGVPTSAVAASAAESENDRLAVLKRSIQDTLENPIFGLGLGNFEIARGAELGGSDAWIGTHNTFTQISSEAGIPALLLFVGLLVTAVIHLKQLDRALSGSPQRMEAQLMSRATLVSLLSFAFGAFFAHLGYDYYFFYPLAIAVGLQRDARTVTKSSLEYLPPQPHLLSFYES